MTDNNTPQAGSGVTEALPEHFATIFDDGYWNVNPKGPHGYNHVPAGWPSVKVYTEEQVRQLLAQSRQPIAEGAATYDQHEIDILVHTITGHDEAEDAIEDLKCAARMLEGKTILDLLNAEHDAARIATPAAGAGGSVGEILQVESGLPRRVNLLIGNARALHGFANRLHSTNALTAREIRSIASSVEDNAQAIFDEFERAPEQATTGSGQAANDARRLDHLQMMAENGFVSMCFEMDGGFHVTLEGVVDQPEAARNVDSIRAGIDWHLAKMDAAILASASPAGEGELTP